MAFIAFVVKRGWVALKGLACLCACVCVCVDEGSNQPRQVSFSAFALSQKAFLYYHTNHALNVM